MILVCAPSGYGKSSLVADWLSDQESQFIWYNLESSDNDFFPFCYHLITSFRQNSPEFGSEIIDILKAPQSPDPQELSIAIANEVTKINVSTALVIDDYHLITEEDIHGLIMLLMKYPHPSIKIILTSRYDPPLPLAEWRGQGKLEEIRSKHLQFGAAETKSLLDANLLDSNEDVNERITEVTEGWVSGIRLLTYGVNGQIELSEKMDGIDKSKTSYFHSLVNQSLAQQTVELRDLILKSAFLESFSSRLLDELNDQSLGRQLINSLRSSKLFIIELDGGQEWYRYHHLFQESLLIEASRCFDNKEIDTIYSKAAEWYLENGLLAKAIEFSLMCRNDDQAIAIFTALRIELLNAGDWVKLQTLYNLFREYKVDHPIIELTHSMLLLYQGKVMEMFELSAKIDKCLLAADGEEDIQFRAELNTLLCYRTYHMEQNYTLCIEQCEYALKHLRSDYLYPRGYAWIFLIGAYQIIGQFRKAEKIAFDQLDSNVSDWESSHIWFVLCYIYYFEVEFEKLKSVAHKLVDFGLKNKNKEALANGYYFLAKRYYAIGEWEKAIIHCDKALTLGAHAIGIVRVFSSVIKTGALEKIGKLDQMKEILEDLSKQTFLKGNTLLSLFVTGHEAEMDILCNEFKRAEEKIIQIPERPLMPITNSSDPHLAIIKFKIYAKDCVGLDDFLSRYEVYLRTQHNSRFVIDIICMKSMLAWQEGNFEKAQGQLLKALKKSERAKLVSPFLDSGRLLENLFHQMPEGTAINPRFTDLLKVKFKERNEYHFNIHMSAREMDILELFAKKLSNIEIGERLFISEKTVKNHSNTIFKKLSVKNRREAVHKAKDLNLLTTQ